ncbi:MAG: protease modulator HflC [Opitutales bacterium]
MKIKFVAIILAVLIGLFTLFSSAYVVQETEQVILTQFGKMVGEPVTDAGLHFKKPFVQDVHRIDKRYLPWDGPANEMSTKKKDFLIIDTFARWRIIEPKLYFTKLRDERTARSRLDDILGSETRNAVAKHEIIEIIRTTKDRVPDRDESLLVSDDANATLFSVLSTGREDVEKEIRETAAPKLKKLGIELLDLRFKRINYNEIVRRQIYGSMIKEREKIAKRYRFEGDGEAARIKGEKERELAVIASEAYREVEEIKGKADASATAIYAEAYNKSPESVEFYTFLKTLETYKVILDRQSSLIMTTDSPLFRLLKNLEGEASELEP